MSIALMTLAWQTALPLNYKAAMLAMSDWANDEGASLYPSIYAIAERMTCSERTVQRLLKDLIEDRWLAVVGNLSGGKPGATRHYHINVRKLRESAAVEERRRAVERATRMRLPPSDALPNPFETGDKLTGVQTGDILSRVTNQVETGDKSGMRRVTNQVETGDTLVTLSTKEPSIEPSRNHQGKKLRAEALCDGFVLPDWMPVDAWYGYVDMRKQIKKPMTQRAVDLRIKDLERFRAAGHNLEAILDRSTDKSWTDLYEPRPDAASHQVIPFQSAADKRIQQRAQLIAELTGRTNPGAPHAAHQPDPRDTLDVTAYRVA